MGLAAGRSIETVVALIALLKRGAAYLPLDPDYPLERSRRAVDLAEIEILVTAPKVATGFLPDLCRATVGSEGATKVERGNRAAPAAGRQPKTTTDGAYVICTSGSTGAPKAVVTTRANLSNFLAGMVASVPLDASDVFLVRTSLCFDPHAVEILLPLVLGARMVILGPDEAADPAALRGAVAEHGATLLQATPTLWRGIVTEDWPSPHPIKALCGGEPLTDSLKRAILGRGGVRLWNVYGPTETTVWCSTLEMSPERPPLIGGPMQGVSFEVRDGEGRALGPGEPGELHIAGLGLAEGYLGQPELTAESFVREGGDGEGEERWYRSGDMVEALEEGTLRYLGRRDRQVKVRGYRVEPGEVEEVLLADEGVRSAVVLLDRDRLAAFLVPAAGERATALVSRLRDRVRQRLPQYMRPARFQVLDRFPTTPTEKIDAEALLRGLRRQAEEPPAQPPPDSSDPNLERMLAIWRELLEADEISPEDRFLDVGGHSLNMMGLRQRVLEQFGSDVSIAQLREHETPLALCGLLASRLDGRAPDRATTVGDSRALTPSQHRYFLETPAADVDENVLRFLVRSPQGRERVLAAAQRVIERHDAFRVDRLHFDGDGGSQRFADAPPAAVEDMTDRFASSEEFIAAVPIQRLRIAEGRLWAWSVFESDEGTHLAASIHHLLADDVSLDVLVHELDAALHEPGAGLPHTASLAEWIDAFGSEDALARYRGEVRTWEAQTDPVASPPFAGDGEQTAVDTLARTVRSLPGAVLDGLGANIRGCHDTLLGAAMDAVGRTFGIDRVGCRVVESGRGLSDGVDDALTVGWLAHHYPLLVAVAADAASTLASLEREQAAIVNRGESYGWLRYGIGIESLRRSRQLGELPLYFNYLPRPTPLRAIVDESSRLPDAAPQRQRIVGLAVVARAGEGTLDARVYRNPDTVSDAATDRFCDLFEANVVDLAEWRRTAALAGADQ